MQLTKILIFVALLIPQVSLGASSLYSTQILNSNFTPVIRSEATPTISTLTNKTNHLNIRHSGTLTTQYTGVLLERPVGNIPNTSALYITYSYTRTAGTCTFALRQATTNVTGASVSLPASVATTTLVWTGMATNAVTSPANAVSLSLGGVAGCNGSLNIIKVATDNPGVIPLSFSSLYDTSNDILYVSTSTATTSTITIPDYTLHFDYMLIIFSVILFASVVLFFRYIVKKYI